MPFAFDGDFIIPVGDVDLMENNHTLITVKDIPQSPGNRSIRQTGKLCFLKLVLNQAPYLLRRMKAIEKTLMEKA